MIRVVVLSFALLGAAGASAQALYEAAVPVAGQGAAERAEAFASALDEVLVRVAGSTAVVEVPGIVAAKGQAGRYVQQYRYLAADGGQELWVRFDATALNGLLRSHGQAVWAAPRTRTLVWLAVEHDGARSLLGNDGLDEYRETLQHGAARRGLPLMLPLLDLEDHARLQAGDVWGNFQERIAEASQRYAADAVLAGRVHRSGAGWRARWALHQRGQQGVVWESEGTLEQALAAGIEGATDMLAARFARSVQEGEEGSVVVLVRDVQDLAAFRRAGQALGEGAAVAGVEPLGIEGGDAVFRVAVRGGPTGLRSAVATSGVLVAMPDVGSGGVGELGELRSGSVPELVLRLVP